MNTVLVTGGSRGIGRAMVELFSKAGYRVAFTYNSSAAAADEVARAFGAFAVKADSKKEDEVISAVQKAEAELGSIDVLINNAGYGLTGACEMLKDEEIKRIFDVDLMGAIYLTKRILPLMQKGGKIINISSACALFPLPYRTMYCSVKAGMNLWSQGLTMELEDCGIAVTSICPGDIKTPFTTNRKHDYATNERYGDAMQRADKKVEKKYNSRMEIGRAHV